ncbi:MAG: DUF6734 family protein [Arcicella sp.]|nr:DUF6734 family protein [Arcicella sp.]
MKVLQTCWFNNPKKLDAGWLSTKFHLMSWALSALSIQKHYPNIELVTDNLGKEILIDKLQLPYSSVSLVQENFKPLFPSLWVLRKLYSYSIQIKPFIHIDGDAYLFKPFGQEFLNARLVAQNYEYNHPYYVRGFEEVMNTCVHIPNYLKKDYQGRLSAVNAGIMGGFDTIFFKRLYQEVTLFLENNQDHLEQLDPFCFNIFLEQFWFKKLADESQIPISYQMSQEIGYPFNYGLDRFWDLPNSCDYIHVMNYKQNPTICEQMAQRLYIESPELYERVVKVANELESTKVSMYVAGEGFSTFYRSALIAKELGFVFSEEETLSDLVAKLPESPQNNVLKDVVQYETEKSQFINNLPPIEVYATYRKQQSLKVNTVLAKSIEEVLSTPITFGEHVTLIESEWMWAEKNEFAGQDKTVDYLLNLQQEAYYYQVVLFCYPVSATIKEQLSDTITILIIDAMQQVEHKQMLVQTVVENVASEIYSLNQSRSIEELSATILDKVRYLLYQGVLTF